MVDLAGDIVGEGEAGGEGFEGGLYVRLERGVGGVVDDHGAVDGAAGKEEAGVEDVEAIDVGLVGHFDAVEIGDHGEDGFAAVGGLDERGGDGGGAGGGAGDGAGGRVDGGVRDHLRGNRAAGGGWGGEFECAGGADAADDFGGGVDVGLNGGGAGSGGGSGEADQAVGVFFGGGDAAHQCAGENLEDVGGVEGATGEIAVDGERGGDELGALASGIKHLARLRGE